MDGDTHEPDVVDTEGSLAPGDRGAFSTGLWGEDKALAVPPLPKPFGQRLGGCRFDPGFGSLHLANRPQPVQFRPALVTLHLRRQR